MGPPPQSGFAAPIARAFSIVAPFKPPPQTSGGIRPYRNLLQRTSIAGRERSNATGEQRHFLVREEMNRVTSTRVETFSALLAIAFPSSRGPSIYFSVRFPSMALHVYTRQEYYIVTHSEPLYRVHRDRPVLLHASDRTFSRAILLFIKKKKNKNDSLYCWGALFFHLCDAIKRDGNRHRWPKTHEETGTCWGNTRAGETVVIPPIERERDNPTG